MEQGLASAAGTDVSDRREEDEEADVGGGGGRIEEASLAEEFNHEDQPPLRPSRPDAGHRTETAGGELTLKTKH